MPLYRQLLPLTHKLEKIYQAYNKSRLTTLKNYKHFRTEVFSVMFNYKQTSYGICISMSNSSFLLNDVHEYSPFSISKEYINHSYFYEYFFYILSFLVCFISYLPKNVQRNCFAIICLYEQHLKNLVANIEPKNQEKIYGWEKVAYCFNMR